MDAAPKPAAYGFFEWRYEPELRRLVGPSGETRLKPLQDRLLRCLLDAPGSVLARDHLIERVWTRREVNDEVLSRAIAELRAQLGDDAREPRYVETLSKGGYRWIAPVERLDAVAPVGVAMNARDAPSPTRRRRGLAAGIAAAVVLSGLAAWLYPRPANHGQDARAPLAVALLAARPLVADPRLEYDARFDATGHVVYIRAERHAGASELVLVDPSSLAERVLWSDEGSLRQPAPSPDGGEVALTRHLAGICELWSVALVDLHRSRLGDCAASVAGGLEWVDEGRALLYTGAATAAQREPGLMLLDRGSGSARVLTRPEPGEGAHANPRLSRDGQWLVYASMRDGEGQLWRTDWPGLQRRTPMLKRPDPLYGHAFEPHGDALWAAGDLTRYRALHRLVNGREPELIGGRGARSIDIAANGAAVWSEAIYDADVWLRGGDDTAWTAVARSNRYESQPEFSADGNRVALISNRGGTESVFVFDRRDGGVRALPLDPAMRWVRPTWSTREDALIVTAYADRRTRLYRLRLDDAVPRPVANVAEGAFHGTELADGLVHMTGNGGGRGQLMQLRAGAAQPEDLGLGIVSAYRASAGWLVWRSEGSRALRAAAWPALRPIREIASDDHGEALALAGDTLYYLDQGQLWALRLPDGEPMRVGTDRLPDGNGPSLAASVDGALAIVTLTSLSIDLMIADGAASAGP